MSPARSASASPRIHRMTVVLIKHRAKVFIAVPGRQACRPCLADCGHVLRIRGWRGVSEAASQIVGEGGDFVVRELVAKMRHHAVVLSTVDCERALYSMQDNRNKHVWLVSIYPFRACQRRKNAWQALAVCLMTGNAVCGVQLSAVDLRGYGKVCSDPVVSQG